MVSFVSTLGTVDKTEILHGLVYLVLHLFWTIACIMSWFFAIETCDKFEFFTCLLWTGCCIMAYLFAVVAPYLTNLLILLFLWTFTGIVSHFFTMMTLHMAFVLLFLGFLQS